MTRTSTIHTCYRYTLEMQTNRVHITYPSTELNAESLEIKMMATAYKNFRVFFSNFLLFSCLTFLSLSIICLF